MLLLVGILAPAAMAGVGFLLAFLLRRQPIALTFPPAPAMLGAGGVAALISMGLISGLFRLNKHLERALKETGTRVGLEALRAAGYPVMLILVTTSAVGEELLFRGGLQPSIGIVLAALLFGFSHGGWRREMWPYVAAACFSGALFGLLYRWTGDIWAPIAAHAIHNTLSTVMLGRSVEWSWKGPIPMIRLVAEPLDGLREPDPGAANPGPDAPEPGESMLAEESILTLESVPGAESVPRAESGDQE